MKVKYTKETPRKILDYNEEKLNLSPQDVEDVLQKGALKAKKVADTTLSRVRDSLGYNS